MTDQTRSEEAVFLAAMQLATAQERVAYVQGACANDEKLRRRVLELLASHDASRSPLDRVRSPHSGETRQIGRFFWQNSI